MQELVVEYKTTKQMNIITEMKTHLEGICSRLNDTEITELKEGVEWKSRILNRREKNF